MELVFCDRFRGQNGGDATNVKNTSNRGYRNTAGAVPKAIWMACAFDDRAPFPK